MSTGEVLMHGRRAIDVTRDDLAWKHARHRWHRRWHPPEGRMLAADARTARMSFGPLSPDRLHALRSRLPHSPEDIEQAARPWAAGRVDVLGYAQVDLRAAGAALDRDPLSGTVWPESHGRRIDYRDGTPGDPKLIWELNRCQDLPLLLLASRLVNDESYRAIALERLLRWMVHHPPGRGIAWTNAFEPSLRAVSIAVVFDGLRGEELGDDSRGSVLLSLWQHGRYIADNLSLYSSANNHLVSELVGLLAIGTLAPELSDAERWRMFALEALAREAELQINPDGTNVEQAFAYGLFTADLMLVAASLTQIRGEEVPAPMVDRLWLFADALCALVDTGEPDPAYGDDDDGRVLVLDGAKKRRASAVAASLAAFLGHPGACRLAGELDVTAVVLFGADGVERFNAAAPAEPAGDVVLRDGGIVALRRCGARLLFDVGPLGYLSIAAHGHADALQVDLSVSTREAITDPGTGSYFRDPLLRRTMRSTRTHGTVAVDGLDQSVQGGPHFWARQARTQLTAVSLRECWAIGEHDGYQRLDPPVSHRRGVVGLPCGYLVVDRLESAQARLYEQSWPLAPDLEPVIGDERVRVRAREAGDAEGDVLALHAASTVPFEIVLDRTARYSRRLEASEPTSVVRCVAHASGEVILAALLVPTGAESHVPETALSLEPIPGGARAHVRVGSWCADVDLSLADQPPTVVVVAQD